MSDGVPVGAISVEIDSREAWFRRVAIREEVQRRGHGRRMIELAVAFAREKGCVHVRSNVDSAAVSFYRKLGFTETNVPLAHSVSMHRAL
jgi:ribosomal protein S18 acetylase RimI-like enzyme